MFTSDNGPHREGGHDPLFWDSNGELKGIKRDVYEGGIRVPYIVRWPGRITPGSTSGHISAFWDMLPTFCEIAGAKTPDIIDGISLLPTLQGEPQKKHDYLYWEFPARGGKQAIRKGDFKAVRLGLESNPDAAIELYNLAVDPGEEHNIADQHPEEVRNMKTLFQTAREESALFPLFGKRVNRVRQAGD